MDEIFLTGYCRALDQSRMVEAELTPTGPEADCAYPDCPYVGSCLIAAQLKAMERPADR